MNMLQDIYHMYLQSAVHVYTTSGIYGIVAITLIWIAQNCLRMLVSRRLYYCNSLLSGVAETDITKLHILNHLACVVTKSPSFTRSVPLLRSLHWLPVIYTPFQDLLADVQGSLRGTTCLPSLLDCYFSSIMLTEVRGITLSIPTIKTNMAQGRSALWNNLAVSVCSATSVDTFRRRLKTYLFNLAFPP